MNFILYWLKSTIAMNHTLSHPTLPNPELKRSQLKPILGNQKPFYSQFLRHLYRQTFVPHSAWRLRNAPLFSSSFCQPKPTSDPRTKRSISLSMPIRAYPQPTRYTRQCRSAGPVVPVRHQASHRATKRSDDNFHCSPRRRWRRSRDSCDLGQVYIRNSTRNIGRV